MKTRAAKWTRKFINDLPDAAFAIIESGGKKDKDGKTEPRRLRHLPHHTDNVKSPTENSSVDLTHLRNALARAPQMKLSGALKKRAISHLEAHAKELLKTRKAKEGREELIKSTAELLKDGFSGNF